MRPLFGAIFISQTVVFFTLGGIGLFFFFLWPTFSFLYETWFGFKGYYGSIRGRYRSPRNLLSG